MADDAQAQNARFRSTLVERFVDDGRRQEKFQWLSASDPGRHLCQRKPVGGCVSHSVDVDSGEAESPTSTARCHQRHTTNVDAHAGVEYRHRRLLDNTEFKPKLSGVTSPVTRHYTQQTLYVSTSWSLIANSVISVYFLSLPVRLFCEILPMQRLQKNHRKGLLADAEWTHASLKHIELSSKSLKICGTPVAV